MPHANRNWRTQWSVALDGTRATHRSGLVATCINDVIEVDEATRDRVYRVLAADPKEGPHAGARMARLLQEAHMIFEKIG